jgi:hypothetical protein
MSKVAQLTPRFISGDAQLVASWLDTTGSDGNATNTPPPLVLTPPTVTASGTAVVHGNASTSPTVISLVVIGTTASGNAVGSNTSTSINLTPPVMFASIGEAWREYYTFDMEVTTTVAFELELTRTVDFTLEL